MDTLGAVVLSGGRSQRFGSDKTRAIVDGVTLLERVLAVVGMVVGDQAPGSVRADPTPVDAAAADRVLVVGDWAPAGVRVEAEPTRDLGPLAGLAHGLARVGAEGALVLAADHPDLQPELLRLLVARSAASEVRPEAVVPVGPTGPEPLVAWYRTDMAARAAARLATGDRSLREFLSTLDVVLVEPDEWRTVDPHGRSFRDVDTPGDLPPRS